MRAQIGSIILATSLVQLSLGFFSTFISLRVKLEQFDDISAGLVLSSYFLGFAIGAVRCGGIIWRIGYIRAYAAFAGCVVIAIASMPILVAPLTWIVFRCLVGFGCAGLFVATESWLNAKAPPTLRGRIFSLYMGGTFLALALGQLLIIGADIAAPRAFNVLTALFASALILVSLTRAEAPQMEPEPRLAYGELAWTAPLAVAGAAVSGFIASCFYALVPAWMQGKGVPQASIAVIMLAAVLGGLVFQIPIGHLSDKLDRRLVLATVGVGLGLSTLTMVNLPPKLAVFFPAAAVLGGFMSTLYPVSVAHAHDLMPAGRLVSVSGRLLLVNGLGSISGPLVGTILMRRYEIDGVLYLMTSAALLLSALALTGRLFTPAVRHRKRPFEIIDPQAAPLASDRH